MQVTIQISNSITYKLKEERAYVLQLLSKTKLPRELKRLRKRPIAKCGREIILNTPPFLGRDWNERAYRDLRSRYPVGELIYQIIRVPIAA